MGRISSSRSANRQFACECVRLARGAPQRYSTAIPGSSRRQWRPQVRSLPLRDAVYPAGRATDRGPRHRRTHRRCRARHRRFRSEDQTGLRGCHDDCSWEPCARTRMLRGVSTCRLHDARLQYREEHVDPGEHASIRRSTAKHASGRRESSVACRQSVMCQPEQELETSSPRGHARKRRATRRAARARPLR